MRRILLVEDDSLFNKTLAYNLASCGWDVTAVPNVRTAERKLAEKEFDLALLDVNLPDGSGYELGERLKDRSARTLLIFLTANDRESDQLRGYETGAVDYITKPFSVAALLKKIRAMFSLLERGEAPGEGYEDGALTLDFSGLTASLNGKPLSLTALEYKMLHLFTQNPGRVLTRRQLLERLWDAEENFVDEHTLTTAVSRLRGKLESGGRTYIRTVYGMGYQWTGGEKK